MIEFLLLWLPLCFVCAWIATQKGRSGVGHFFLALFFSPIIGFLVLMALPSRRDAASGRVASDHVLCSFCGRPMQPGLARCPRCQKSTAPDKPATKACPMCAETVLAAAVKCRFCGAELSAPRTAVGAMGYCNGCGKLRGVGTMKCVYCGDVAPVSAEPPRR